MNILLIGQGGREHAIAWKLAQSPLCETLYASPGNVGMTQTNTNVVLIPNMSMQDYVEFCHKHTISYVVIGPETPLVEGLVDYLEGHGIPAFGPKRYPAQLEGSKRFTKEFCLRYGIPTAPFKTFSLAHEAKAYLRNHTFPLVIKDDALASGKGVIIAHTLQEAENAIDLFLGKGRHTIVIEEFLTGVELSYFAICDAHQAHFIGAAHDYKRAYTGDIGPNTGGMGAYSPSPFLTPELKDIIEDRILTPTLNGLQKEGHPYKGFLYAGLMLTQSGPFLIEYNVRLGDPEAQVILPLLNTDLVALIQHALSDSLADIPIIVDPHRSAVTVILANQGYPYSVGTKAPISGLESVPQKCDDLIVFHAGTQQENSTFLASGGRVLAVTALGETITTAREQAYRTANTLHWDGKWCREDIAQSVSK